MESETLKIDTVSSAGNEGRTIGVGGSVCSYHGCEADSNLAGWGLVTNIGDKTQIKLHYVQERCFDHGIEDAEENVRVEMREGHSTEDPSEGSLGKSHHVDEEGQPMEWETILPLPCEAKTKTFSPHLPRGTILWRSLFGRLYPPPAPPPNRGKRNLMHPQLGSG